MLFLGPRNNRTRQPAELGAKPAYKRRQVYYTRKHFNHKDSIKIHAMAEK